MERGEKNATLESIQKVAQALNIPLSQLFEKIEEKQNEESIPLQIYDFFSSKNKKEQKYLYQILKEIDDYKNSNLKYKPFCNLKRVIHLIYIIFYLLSPNN